jgi:ATP-dependent DNA helicase RecQ
MVSEVLDPRDHLHRFGLTEFRPGQRAVIDAVFAGRDCLCIMPTGGGKSLCYQLPSVARPGVTVVVSPLIALMKDQVDSMLRQGIAATFINSSLTVAEQSERLSELKAGRYDLVYVAPERLRNDRFLEAIADLQVQMLAIDEAHCISQWGHDFRPDYQRLGRFRKRLRNPQTIALTATATRLVQEDITRCLELEEPAIFVSGFARDNLSLFVESPYGGGAKDQRLLEFLDKTPGCGIIYAATRKNCEKLVELLRENLKRPVAFYHAGLEPAQRRMIQDQFMSGDVPIIIATNAFGMGVDKADLRFVVHYQLPGSLEAYYQEVGRAGRDGRESRCLLLFSYQDRFIQEFFIENNYPSRATVEIVYEFLRRQPGDPIELTLQDIKEAVGCSLGTEGIATCQKILEQAGALERLDTKQNLASIRVDSDQIRLVDAVGRDAKNQRRVLALLEPLVADRRRERVYFSPNWVGERTGLKSEAVSKTLRDLSKLSFFDYVPPFRGRAIHFRRRDLPFSQLKIDFSELERRKQAELDRLERVLSFCRSSHCRQLDILQYFGDPGVRVCGKCDHCRKTTWEHAPLTEVVTDKPPAASGPEDVRGQPLGEGPTAATKVHAALPLEDAVLTTVQVALSGAARTHGRIGKGLLAQMLAGSTAQKLQSLRLHRVKTFGALKWLTLKEVNTMIELLLDAGLLTQMEINRFRPTVEISPRGTDVMQGKIPPPPLKIPRPLSRKIQELAPLRNPQRDGTVSGLEDLLTNPDLARELVKSAGSPTAEREVDRSGVLPPVKPVAEHQATVQQVAADHSPAVEAAQWPHDSGEPSDPQQLPDYYWTWRMFVEGFSLEETAAIRRLTIAQVNQHLQRAASSGLVVNPNW